MPTVRGGLTNLDIKDPADAQLLVDNGYAWRSGPRTMQAIMGHILNGTVSRRPDKETPEVTAYLNKVAPLPPAPLEPGEVIEEPQ